MKLFTGMALMLAATSALSAEQPLLRDIATSADPKQLQATVQAWQPMHLRLSMMKP